VKESVVRVVDAIAGILKAEGVSTLSCYPTTPLIDAASDAGIRPIVCRQERVGVGIADGYARVCGAGHFGVFAMQYGPGTENAYSGVASAFSDGVPILLLPLGNALDRSQIRPLFSAASYASITKSVETVTRPSLLESVMRRAVSGLRSGTPGPVMVEIPMDVATAEMPAGDLSYAPVVSSKSAGSLDDVERAVEALLAARAPVILAGQGVLRANAMSALAEFAETVGIPVVTTLAGKGAIDEDHPLAAGTASVVASDVVVDLWRAADLVFAIGASMTRHFLSPELPSSTKLIMATANPDDLNKSYHCDGAILGDAGLVLRQLIQAVREHDLSSRSMVGHESAGRLAEMRSTWLATWLPILTSEERPISPYRVIFEFDQWVNRAQTIVTHDSGSPRDQLVPFYRAGRGGYIGWGKSHALGGGLGLIMGAKLAAPEKLAVHLLGDAAFGMTGLDIETAARNNIPIMSILLNNSTMAIETGTLVSSHERYGTRDIAGDYTAIAQALGVQAKRVTDPGQLVPSFEWARRVTADGHPVLLEIITSAEVRFSNRKVISVPHF
jgi:acetolactate synthase I/II/III large subunit